MIKCYKETFPESVLFIAPDPIPIYWSDFSLLQADLECMEYLLSEHSTWKYFINQAGTAMPAVTINELTICFHEFSVTTNLRIFRETEFVYLFVQKM